MAGKHERATFVEQVLDACGNQRDGGGMSSAFTQFVSDDEGGVVGELKDALKFGDFDQKGRFAGVNVIVTVDARKEFAKGYHGPGVGADTERSLCKNEVDCDGFGKSGFSRPIKAVDQEASEGLFGAHV